jgi:hypothetical protein
VEIELREVTPDDPIAIRALEAARSEITARKADGGASAGKPAVEAMLGDRDIRQAGTSRLGSRPAAARGAGAPCSRLRV